MAEPDHRFTAAAAQAIRDGLADLAGVGGDDGRMLEYHRIATAAEPVALFTVDTDLLRKARDLGALVQVGWRSILYHPLGGTTYADAAGEGGNLRFSRLVSSARADAMAEATDRLRVIAGNDTPALRVVESSRLKVAALWLDAPDAVFLPFAGLPSEPIGQAAFLTALERLDELQRSSVDPEPLNYAAARSIYLPPIAAFSQIGTAGTLGGALVRILEALRHKLRATLRRDRVPSDHDDEGPTVSSG